MCVNNVRSQREIHLGVSSFRVFFLFFFEARERERERRHIFFIIFFFFFFFEARERERATHIVFIPLSFWKTRALFRNGLWGKEGLQREEVVVGSLFVILRVVVGREREQEEGLL